MTVAARSVKGSALHVNDKAHSAAENFRESSALREERKMTVLSSDAAHQEATKMMAIITNDFPALVGKLNGHGRTLSDPKHWDGPLAQRFRSEVWPQASRDLEKMHTSLRDLQQQVQKILTAIDRAGGVH